ncbi:hypothetical protein OG738_43430 [Amycolatopsis sp. NBC_01488]|uniref:hypothetical protein n=1 Tax=Amycolatopsis sp. NBC_01488 TaxID=2903563 RepID=UPI002E27FCE3|nr:hypothetical protein [Amycolatopsis sp. NBC_01488]
MSTLRRLAFAGAFALPISLVIAGPSSASTFDSPFDTWSTESSGAYAGIGGAGTTDTEEGTDCWGHHWSEEDTAVAGIGGAAVVHSEGSGDDTGWTGGSNDADDDVAVPHHAAHHPDPDPDAEPATHHARPAHHHDAARPAHHHSDDDASYVADTQSADIDGATSSHVESHAGDDYATYESGALTAGPDGASSSGVHSLAVPGYAGYHNWYVAADEDGATVHSVSTVADATDGWDGRHHED